MNKVLVLDVAKCNGCRSCEVACSVAREGLACPTRSRIRIVPFEADDFYFPLVCQQCEVPYCALVCPTNALRKNPETGVIEWLEQKCVGCKMCLLACPFGAITLGEDARLLKCELCGGDPVCVKFCKPEALTYATGDEIGASKRVMVAESIKKSHLKEE